MVAKSIKATAAQRATQRLDEVITSHRDYFAQWRSTKFDRSPPKEESAGGFKNKTQAPKNK